MALIQANFYSDCLHRNVPFNALVPVDRMDFRTAPPALPLKTLYLLHGYMCGCTDWLWNSKLGELSAEYGIAIILPDGENHFYVDDFQRYDLYGEYVEEKSSHSRGTYSLFPPGGKTPSSAESPWADTAHCETV
jgi:hypothetical protein